MDRIIKGQNGGGGGSRTRVSLVFTRGVFINLTHKAELNFFTVQDLQFLWRDHRNKDFR